jgi:hypothetical protein
VRADEIIRFALMVARAFATEKLVPSCASTPHELFWGQLVLQVVEPQTQLPVPTKRSMARLPFA